VVVVVSGLYEKEKRREGTVGGNEATTRLRKGKEEFGVGFRGGGVCAVSTSNEEARWRWLEAVDARREVGQSRVQGQVVLDVWQR